MRISQNTLCLYGSILCNVGNVSWIFLGKILCILEHKLCISGEILRISEIILCIFCGKFFVLEETFCGLFWEMFCAFQKTFGVLSKQDFLYFRKHLM